MTDIVDELRATNPRDSGYAETANKAADEIQRLRAELAGLKAVAGCLEIPLKTFADIKKEAKNGND